MKFTDIFIRRPVLATVVSLLILVLGLRAVGSLAILEFPRTENAIVTVSTAYYGADPDVAARLAVLLGSSASDGVSGRLISAVWDRWAELPARRDALRETDLYTLRRIVPSDRGLDW